jgi:hypothetical protein
LEENNDLEEIDHELARDLGIIDQRTYEKLETQESNGRKAREKAEASATVRRLITSCNLRHGVDY